MATGIYRFDVDYGRGYGVEAVFAASEAEIASIMGKEIYFGEICGKHSEITATPDEKNLRLLTDDPVVVRAFIKFGFASGHNPLHYAQDME